MRLLRLLGVLARHVVADRLPEQHHARQGEAGWQRHRRTDHARQHGGAQGHDGRRQAARPTAPMMNKAELERTAERMGKGVRLRVDRAGQGRQRLRRHQGDLRLRRHQPGSGQPGPEHGRRHRRAARRPSRPPTIRSSFKLTRSGGTSTLTINFIDKPAPAPPSREPRRPPATCPTSPTR